MARAGRVQQLVLQLRPRVGRRRQSGAQSQVVTGGVRAAGHEQAGQHRRAGD
jgi:hypothetical protein